MRGQLFCLFAVDLGELVCLSVRPSVCLFVCLFILSLCWYVAVFCWLLCILFVISSFVHQFVTLLTFPPTTQGALDEILDEAAKAKLVRWLLQRQQGGFQGRPHKDVDTCYSFWVFATLHILQVGCCLCSIFIVFTGFYFFFGCFCLFSCFILFILSFLSFHFFPSTIVEPHSAWWKHFLKFGTLVCLCHFCPFSYHALSIRFFPWL